ncbi:Elongator complex protein 5 [Phytophthora cinnamomi]|uniref:Elongator complex protein 5 n=1 Tax=Phytophthora cinnamomi TaxID=4785 RepID=UPI00355A21E4|nr:Elongator complex protein 5 [Phytophthora cinnamomi]
MMALVVIQSLMEEFLLHHCVTSDAPTSGDDVKPRASPSIWQSSGRAECVLVQENRQAHGASRVTLSAMLKLTLQSAKTSNVLLLTLDSPQLAQGVGGSSKLTLVDYSADAANFQSSTSSSQLVPKIMRDIESAEAKVTLEGATSARPMVVMLDSLNVLLQQTSLQQVLLLLRQLRSHAVIGSVIVRLNASAESSEVAQALAAQATALVLVETRSSLRSYPLLAKERRREIPQGMHGFVLLVRQKKNGRSSESLEYFQVLHGNIRFIAAADIDGHAVAAESAHQQKDVNPKTPEVDAKKSEFQRKSQFDAKSPAISRPTNPESTGQALLPVRQEEVSFNLSISAEEQQAKSQVHLPYMHQGSGGANSNPSDVGSKSGSSGPAAGNNTLFFIDEDDPDWDDDDLDDDLDI